MTTLASPAPVVPIDPVSCTFGRRPLLAYLELTRACDLACRHCRAEANRSHHPLELRTREIGNFLEEIRGFGTPPPHVVFTGGDPMMRDDLFHLISLATGLELPVSLSPSGTERLTPAVLRELRGLGIVSLSLSLDGSSPERHDDFRGVPGCFERTLDAARAARSAEIPLQINTLVTAETAPDLPALYEAMRRLDIERWSVFFLISVGRGRDLTPVTPEEAERLFHWFADRAAEAPFAIKTTEAMSYRRIVYRRLLRKGYQPDQMFLTGTGRGFGVRDGNGILFVSHTGFVYPSGFMPVPAGNVRSRSIVDIYRDSRLFRRLRNPDLFRGKCGRCEYRWICGGSRARAWAATGDPLESDPLCLYRPKERRRVP